MEKPTITWLDLPKEIQKVMLDRQYEQSGERNVKVFKECLGSSLVTGGFDWDKTPEGYDFWLKINEGDFKTFFEKYPKEFLSGPKITGKIVLDEEPKKEKLFIRPNKDVRINDKITHTIGYGLISKTITFDFEALRYIAEITAVMKNSMKELDKYDVQNFQYAVDFLEKLTEGMPKLGHPEDMLKAIFDPK